MFRTIPPNPLDLIIGIQWATEQAAGPLPITTEITEQPTGEKITTVSAMAIYVAHDEHIVWAELDMYADENGKPILTGKPVVRGDGTIIRRIFTAHILKMRSVSSYREGHGAGSTLRIRKEAAAK